MTPEEHLSQHYNLETGELTGGTVVRRHLSDVRGAFADTNAVDGILKLRTHFFIKGSQLSSGSEPLTYFGVYPANAGHDYGSLVEKNFRKVLIDKDGAPTLIDRDSFIPAK
jgi:hypothetical protein